MRVAGRMVSLFLAVFICIEIYAVSAYDPKAWDPTQPRGNTREVDFTTDEGTWMSADISPDGQWVVFDLLAQIYRVPVKGGEAQCLTQDSGIALNYHPRFSPDGKRIVFGSDRGGQQNLWVMDADGKNVRPVFLDMHSRMAFMNI
jgi:tricorn protease-like protein